MLARTSRLQHPIGSSVDTPLLVPSFSSKGFGTSDAGVSEIRNIFEVTLEYLTETMLVSAYDLSYGHLDEITSAITELTFVDSGGYEISDFHDHSSVYIRAVNPKEWNIDMLHEVYSSWPVHVPAVFVSYDHPDIRIPLKDQIESARDFFADFPNHLHTLLVKPETKDQNYIQHKNVISHVEDLFQFDILGLTEKELGNSILDRMTKIAKIRLAMDDEGIDTPIHIYGSLDPLTSTLYFLSGAEIFDGLTWLRYAYMDGAALYIHNYGVRDVGINRLDKFIRAKTWQENLNYLIHMDNQMRNFMLDYEFDRFHYNGVFLRECYDLLRTKIERV